MRKRNNEKLKWFKIEDIPRVNYFMIIPIFKKYGYFIAKQGGSDYFNHVLWIFEKGTATLCYVRDDFNRGIEFLLNKITKNPSWAENLNKEIVGYTKKYLSFAKSLENKDYSKLSDNQLVRIFNQLVEYQRESHNSGQVTTWLIDADRHLFSNHLQNLLSSKAENSDENINLAETFSILTTPEKPSFVEIESRDSLNIVNLLEKDKRARDIFLRNNINEIEQQLHKMKPELRRKINFHYRKYLWLHYNYEGPILELDYFLEVWKGLLKQKNSRRLLKESRDKFINIKKKRALLFKQLGFNKKEKKLLDIAGDIVWLKGWRKDCMYFGSYVLDKVGMEIGKRLGLSLKQVRFFCDWEIEDALLKNKFNVDELNERYNFSVIYSDSKNIPRVYLEKKARDFLKKSKFIQRKFKSTDKLKGDCASPGKVKGTVKIVETIDDMGKMEKGNILLSETTYPALVPAMKLASAIVTNVGGLTCHAAIVSRELKIPCVVGTKIATKALKDGDLVEVDAEKGIVRILKKK